MTFLILIIIVIYLLCASFVIYDRTEHVDFIWNDNNKLIKCDKSRDVEPLDIWIGLCWPILLLWFVIKTALYIIHYIISYLLLMFFIRYVNTNAHKRINKFLFGE